MQFIENVYSTQYPILLDINSSPSTIYKRENVREEIISEEGCEDIIMYVYDEAQYTPQEYCLIQSVEVETLKEHSAKMLLEMARMRIMFTNGSQTLI